MISPRFVTSLGLSKLFVHFPVCLIKAANFNGCSATVGHKCNHDYRDPNDRKDRNENNSRFNIYAHKEGSRKKWHLPVYLSIVVAVCPITKSYAETLPTSIPYYDCFIKAGNRYRVSPALLMAIAYNESRFKPTARNVRASERDLGVMQINSWWLPKLKRYNINESHLTKYPCVNINVGAWIYASIPNSKNSVSQALGIYNAGYQPGLNNVRAKYAKNVLEDLHHFNQLINGDSRYVANRD